MRVEYSFDLEDVAVPCFSVESMEGPQKLFQLATLVLNVLATKPSVDIIFHSPNQADLPKKIEAFQTILSTAPTKPRFHVEDGSSGSLGSSYYKWVTIRSSGAASAG